MKTDEFLLRLGKFTANAQAFEVVTAQILGACLGVENDVAIRLARRIQLRTCLGFIGDLVESGNRRLDPEGLKAWLKSADAAIDARNRVMHTAWHGDPKTNDLLGIISKKGLLESRSSDDFQKDHETLATAVDEGARLVGMESTGS